MKKLFQKFKSDRADSLVTTIIVVPLLISTIITGVDYGFLMNNQSAVSNAARDGARTIAILGGNDPNNISAKYGNDSINASECFLNGVPLSVTECQIYQTLETSSLVQLNLNTIECSPGTTSYVGQDVECDVSWNYEGLPLSTLNLVFLAEDDTNAKGLGFTMNTRGTAKAETSVQS